MINRSYGEFADDRDATVGNAHLLRTTRVLMLPKDPTVLLIVTENDCPRVNVRATRLSVQQARDLRDMIDRFLADQFEDPRKFEEAPEPAPAKFVEGAYGRPKLITPPEA